MKEQLENRLAEILLEAKEIERKLYDLSNVEKKKFRDERDRDRCHCGHERKKHGKARSINFTDGPCSECRRGCLDFMQKP